MQPVKPMAFTFPIPAFPDPQQADLFRQWADTTRRVHQAAEWLLLQALLGQAPDPDRCWSAAAAGQLPAGLDLPDPDGPLLIPRLRRSARHHLSSDGLRDHTRALVRQAGGLLPCWIAEPISKTVYGPLALHAARPHAQAEPAPLGSRRFGDLLRAPGMYATPRVPLPRVTLESPHRVSLPVSGGPGLTGSLEVPAAVYHLPDVVWNAGEQGRGELQFYGGRWTLWVSVRRTLTRPPLLEDVVGVDPGIRSWLTCADRQGAFGLPGPASGQGSGDGPLGEADVNRLREVLDAACARLLPYRKIALEGVSLDSGSWPGREGQRLQALGHGLLREWLAGFANGFGDRDLLLVPAFHSSRQCGRCGARGELTPERRFVCSSCGHSAGRDANAATVLRQRASAGRPYRRDVLHYLHYT